MATTNIRELFNEMAALAAVTAVVQTLNGLVNEENTKRRNKSVEQRRERWLQLAQLAEQQAGRTVAAAPKRKAAAVKAKPAPAPATGGCIALEAQPA